VAVPNSHPPLPAHQPRLQTRAGQLADAVGQWSRAAVAVLFWSTVVTAAASAAYVCVRASIWAVSMALEVLGG